MSFASCFISAAFPLSRIKAAGVTKREQPCTAKSVGNMVLLAALSYAAFRQLNALTPGVLGMAPVSLARCQGDHLVPNLRTGDRASKA